MKISQIILGGAGRRFNGSCHQRVRDGQPAAGDCHAHTHEHTHRDEHTYRHANSNANRYAHGDCHANQHLYANSHADALAAGNHHRLSGGKRLPGCQPDPLLFRGGAGGRLWGDLPG